MISVMLPSCNEKFLQRTIKDLLSKAKGEIEIIAYLDGSWPDPPIDDDPRVVLIHSSVQLGMNNAINSMARVARGKYIMKLDAHCLVDEGFDTKLAEDMQDDWLVVPRRYSLDDENWVRGNKVTDYMYISVPNFPPDPLPHKFWDRGFHGIRYKLPDRDNILIDDLMSFQGSSWFMNRDFFLEIGGLDYGYFWHEAQQLGVKVWLYGGRCVRNKKTWYAHLHKGKKHGRGYYLSRTRVRAEAHTIIDLWMNDKWPLQKRPFKWLVEKFMPIPGWDKWDWGLKWKPL